MTCSRPPAPNLLNRRGEPLFFFFLALFSLFPHLPALPLPFRVLLAHSHFLASLSSSCLPIPDSFALSLSLSFSRSCSLSPVYWLGSSQSLNVNFPPDLSSSFSSRSVAVEKCPLKNARLNRRQTKTCCNEFLIER